LGGPLGEELLHPGPQLGPDAVGQLAVNLPSMEAMALVSSPAMRASSITAAKWIRASRIIRPKSADPPGRSPKASARR
jgi:hypothetical protein